MTPDGGVDWTSVITGAENTLYGIFGPHGQGPYVYNPYGQPVQQPAVGTQPVGGGGIGVGISTNTLLLIAVGLALFMLGTKRGR